MDVGDLQGDGAEHVDDEQVGRPRGVRRVEPGVGQQFQEPFVQGERVRAVHGPADHQADGTRVRREACPQIQGERLDAFAPGTAAVREDVVVDLAQQALDEGLDHCRLVREVRVDGVRCHADPCGDAAHGRRIGAALVEKAQRRVQDLVLGQGPARTATALPWLARTLDADYPLDICSPHSRTLLYTVQILYTVQGDSMTTDHHRPGSPPHDRRAVRRRRPCVRRGGHGAVVDVRLAGHPAGTGRRGAAGVRRRRHEPGLDLVRHRLDLRDPRRPDPAAPGGPGPARRSRRCGSPPTWAPPRWCCRSIGFLRWVFVVPPLADSYVAGDATTRAAVDAAWTAQHQFGGALLGEHLGQLLVIGWSVTLSVIILRSRVLPRWLGVAGLVVSAIYLLNQGDILATAVPGFPVWDLAGLLGSTGWGLWVAALGVVLLLRPSAPRSPALATAPPARAPAATPTQRPAACRPEELTTMTRARARPDRHSCAPGCSGPPGSSPSRSPVSPAPRSPAASTARSPRWSAAPSPGSSSAPARRWPAAAGSTSEGGSRPPRSAWASGCSSAPSAVGYRTSLADLALMGALTGLVLGVAQALALPRRTRRRWVWAAAMPALWALGWTVTTLGGIAVDEQFTIFGAYGAVTFSALSGLLLHALLPLPHRRPASDPAPTPVGATA